MRISGQVVEDSALLLRRIVESFTDYPADLTLESKLLPGRVDWRLRVNVNDHGKVIGRNGSHIRALQYLWAQVGESCGQYFVLRLDENPVGKREPEKRRPTPNPAFSCVGHKALLSDFLDQVLSERPAIEVRREQARVEFVFVIDCERVQDYERLVCVTTETTQTVITELGTLFRAAGHKNGVGFKLEVPKR